MKTFGKVVLVGAAIVGLYALFVFDPSVSTDVGRRVNNIGLMQDRQNLLIASCAAAVIGCILMVFGGRKYGLNTSSTSHMLGSSEMIRNQPNSACETFRDALKVDDAIVVQHLLRGGEVRAYQELPTGRGFLQFAVRMNAVKCISLLLAAGADVTQLDSAGKTALDFSEQATPEVQALLKQSQVHATQHVDVESMNVGVATQLAQLASLHAQGVLTAEEFTLAKGRILA